MIKNVKRKCLLWGKNGQAPLLDATCLYMLNVYAAVLGKKNMLLDILLMYSCDLNIFNVKHNCYGKNPFKSIPYIFSFHNSVMKR